MTAKDEILSALLLYMSDELMLDIEGGVKPDTELFETGIVDSFDLIESVTFLESRFGVVLEDSDLLSGSVSTPASSAELAFSRLNQQRGRGDD